MSDGISDAAASSHGNAMRLVASNRKRWPGRLVDRESMVGEEGRFVLVYEEWLDHVVEVVSDGVVLERWLVGPFDFRPVRLAPESAPPEWHRPGYYRHARLDPAVKEARRRSGEAGRE